MQRLRSLQVHDHVTVGVPAVLGEVLGDAVAQQLDHPLLVTREPVVVSRPECHGITVRREGAPTRQRAGLHLGLPLQRLGDLLRHHAAAEYPGEGVADHSFEAALEAPHYAHYAPPLQAGSHFRSIVSGRSRQSRHVPGGAPTRDRVLRSLGRVAEWQTRTVQVRVSERTWGFNSPLAHF